MDNFTVAKIYELWEDFQQKNYDQYEPISIKQRAVRYLRKKVFGKLSRRDMRRLSAKIHKIKNSENKLTHAKDEKLKKDLQKIIND